MLVTGCWILDAGRCLLDTGNWLQDAGYWLLVSECWILGKGGDRALHAPLLNFCTNNMAQLSSTLNPKEVQT